ncbi:MAG: dTDP-4-dehydrorhamnose reductase [Phycisphaeraceae bacterium]|nr:dTDP-4-dehydrorhamnose reductase [Phycisphaeraceae bacterium]
MSDLARVAILGGRGMLGTDLAATLCCHGIEPVIYDLPDFDLTQTDKMVNALADVNWVVNCAAYTNVDGAEADQSRAYEVNAEAVGQLGRLAAEAGVPVLHISTDFVFDGQGDQPYTETDRPNPISVYGASKWQGEQALSESGCLHCVVRVQWTYGHAGTNFIKKICERARTQGQLKVVDDQVGSPTATVEVAKALLELMQKQAQGLYHYASLGYVSRFRMAEFLIKQLGLSVKVEPCKTSEFVCPAARPLNSRFDCGKISQQLDEPILPWQTALTHYLEQL